MGSVNSTVDRALSDLSTIKISDLHHLPLGQRSPLKNELLKKTSILRVSFLPRYRSVQELAGKSLKYSRWATSP